MLAEVDFANFKVWKRLYQHRTAVTMFLVYDAILTLESAEILDIVTHIRIDKRLTKHALYKLLDLGKIKSRKEGIKIYYSQNIKQHDSSHKN